MVEYKARQQNVTIDYETGKKIISFLVESVTNEDIESCRGKDLRVSIKTWREKRSLDANSYYWKLITELASALKMPVPELHNRMLMEYGVLETIDGHTVQLELPDTHEAERKAYLSTTYHLRPTSEVFFSGYGTKRVWQMLKASHEMDTKEFSNLIEGIVDECKMAGINTLPPDKIAAMMAAYEETKRKEH